MTKFPSTIDAATIGRLRVRLRGLYEEAAEACLTNILRLISTYAPRMPTCPRREWDQRDVVLITYGDQIQNGAEHPLRTLREFLTAHGLGQHIRIVHILPFSPYSSDDGFSVIDFRAVDQALGDWGDIGQLSHSFDLMFDLVLNHCSRQSRWFREFVAGHEPYAGYFIDTDPTTDLSQVTRPRSLPLLTPVETSRGQRHVWTTFSADQIDLNYANPDVLVEMTEILLYYVEQGARIVRLDAIAYLWKQLGTSCIHLQQTHEVVKFFRDLLAAVAPHVLLLTETNVPHAENVSYFGDGDEAHMVYQFSLPPLLMDAMLNQDARPFVAWLGGLESTPPGTTFFNFTASHDGVGVRPLEGLISNDQMDRLVELVKARGGLVSMRQQPDGTEAPYEMNVSYVSALGEPNGMAPELHARRFLTSQALMLSLQGLPAVYFHSLVGTANDTEGARRDGQPRRINRRRFELDELTAQLANTSSLQSRIFVGYCHLLSVRIRQPAFHPDADQDVWPVDEDWLVALLRTSIDQKQRILVLANVSSKHRDVDLSRFAGVRCGRDLLTERHVDSTQRVEIEPWGVVWLEAS